MITSAIKVSVIAAIPIALLIVLGPAFGRALVDWNLAVSVAVPAAVVALVAAPLARRAPQQPRRTAS